MSVILEIGSYKINSAEQGSTSSTTGALLLLPQGPSAKWTEDRFGAEFSFAVQVVGANNEQLNSRVDELTDAVVRGANQDVVLKSGSNEVRGWRVSTGQYSRITGAVENDVAEDTALCLIAFRAERVDIAQGDPDGALGPVNWDFAADSNGRASAAARATFETRAKAIAWVVALRAGTAVPDWLPGNMRFVSPIYGMEKSPSGETAVDGDYRPCTVTGIFNILPEAFAGNSAFDNVIDVDVESEMVPRPPIDEDSGSTPGSDVIISGSIQFKTEVADDFDGGDTDQVTAGQIRQAALACIDAIEEDAKTRHAAEWVRVSDPPDLRINVARGVVLFTLKCLATGGNIIGWTEDLRITRTTRDIALPGDKGDRNYPHRLGPQLRCSHDLTITALATQDYPRPPFLDSQRWREEYLTPGKPSVQLAEGGFAAIVQRWVGEWTLLSDGNEQDRGGTSFSSMAGAI